jgi:hypothetical protein
LKDRSNFLVFIMLDHSDPPPWLPDNQIRLNFSDYGLKEAIGAIKYRLQELGAVVREETISERAARSARIHGYDRETQRLFGCQEGVEQATDAAALYLANVAKFAGDLRESFPNFRIGQNIREVAFTTGTASFRTEWSCSSINILRDASIEIRIYSHKIPLPGDPVHFGNPPASCRDVRFSPHREDGRGWCWKSTKDNQLRTSEELAKYAVGLFLDQVEGKGDRETFQAFFI